MKKLLTFILSVLLVVMVVACTENVSAIGGDDIDDNNPIIDSVDDPQPIELNPVVADPDPEPVVTPDPEPEPEPQIDPNEQLTWDYLEVDEAWLKSYGGVGLKRDGKLYSLSDCVPCENSTGTNVGAIHGNSLVWFGFGDYDCDQIVFDDEFIIPCVNGEDDLCWYGEPVGSLKLVPMEFYGNTVQIVTNASMNDDGNITFIAYMDSERGNQNYSDFHSLYYDNAQLLDSKGVDYFSDFRESNNTLGFRKLNYNEKYTLEWDENGEHKTKELVAFWKYYKATDANAITLTSIETDDPLIEKYDFSSVPSGLYYMVESYAMVEVKND